MALLKEKINLLTIGGLADPVKMVEWSMRMGLIADRYVCPVCNENMMVTVSGDRKYVWTCTTDSHDVKRSVRKGSWFETMNELSMNQILQLTYLWVLKLEDESIMIAMDVSSDIVVDWKQFCRDVCMELCRRENDLIGGDGVVVELDESKFGKRKLEKGRYVEGNWMFRGAERGSDKCFFAVVSARSKECLLNAITENVRPGSTIMSDCWRTYNCLEDEDFRNLSVDHNYTFIHPATSTHTNSIETTWSTIKKDISTDNCSQDQSDSYLYEYMWRKKHRNQRKILINLFLEGIKGIYVPETHD